MNRFITVGSELCETNLPSIPQCQDKLTYSFFASQIRGIILLPTTAPLPSDWTTSDGWDGIIDNSETAGQKGKYLAVIGSLSDNRVETQFPKGRKQIIARDYQLNATYKRMDSDSYEFMKYMQRFTYDHRLRFWYETSGGNLFGGPEGIRESLIDIKMPLEGELNSYEKAVIEIQFRADTAQRRTTTPFTSFEFAEQYQTVIEDGQGTVITDDSGVAIGVY